MNFFALATVLAVLAAIATAAPSSSTSFSILERDTPTCWLDGKIDGTCSFKCEQRGASSGSCKTGTCVCSYGKRSEVDPQLQAAKRAEGLKNMHKRWSCQLGQVGGKGLSNTFCSASCADASGGKKDGYCNSEDTCICKA